MTTAAPAAMNFQLVLVVTWDGERIQEPSLCCELVGQSQDSKLVMYLGERITSESMMYQGFPGTIASIFSLFR